MCEYCNKKLVSIGLDRANGKGNYRDWEKRKYHKACFKWVATTPTPPVFFRSPFSKRGLNGLGEGVNNREFLENLKVFASFI